MINKQIPIWLDRSLPTTFYVSQFDTIWTFQFELYLNSGPWTIPNGVTVAFNGKKPDGNIFSFPCTVSGNVATVNCDIQMTACDGDVICELSIDDAGNVLGSPNFTMNVEKAPKAPADISSESTIPAYAGIISDQNKLSNDIETLETLVATLHPVTIISQPSDFSGALNDVARFSVEARGAGLTYMWQSNASGSWGNTSFSTSKSATVSIRVTAARNGYKYRCVVTDAAGNQAISNPATLTVTS